MLSGSSSPRSSPSATTTVVQGLPGRTIARSSTLSSGTCTPAPLGRTPPSVTAPGRPSMTASGAGVGTPRGRTSLTRFCCASTKPAASTVTCGWSMPPSSAPAGPLPGRKKNPDQLPLLSGPESLQVQEPQDHALGRSRGGFGTKIHLVCDSHGIMLAVWATPGQQHESQAMAVVLLRARRPRRAGRRRWPRRVAADKGYSYPGIREWLRQRRIGPVIPTRKNQPRDATFDRVAYRRRSRIEQVVGWYKAGRALGTRYEELAVNYGALWMVTIVEDLLRQHLKGLHT